ncbi:HPF/RaiA family ribosome-associated protein [Tunturiibacter gelidoferens]|jgi:ribosome-associated translation inhibitor RaiA|uniref:Ribosome-associated translation inhibitor RaiA n=1 Tax=Tunturiibacter gelidiferens TaxID=3069689 RepID=A0A9X0QGX3_9BACT|nr:HPF/RaiA family ribosome-associated protein [Edaphobacter lichenicola]MBB5330161.1 ribosome-associated translation inhibitor RaiA [Edaphobacter lichenicola]
MQIQISSDKNISMHSKLSNLIDSDLNRILDRFKDEITRVEVHLSDENGDKSGAQDKRCSLEVRPKRHQSLAVTNDSSDIPTAVTGAGAKMVRLLVSTFGRIEDKNRSLTTRASGEGQNLVLKPDAI